jgi:putative PIN family toxin of toxin-antitoxin system
VRVVLDTNILLAALISPTGPPARIYEAWQSRRFWLLTSDEQLEELSRVTRYPTIRALITVSEAGRMVNQIRALATVVKTGRRHAVSADPADDFLFAIAEAGEADYIVTGDKGGVLGVGRYGRTRTITARRFVALIQ